MVQTRRSSQASIAMEQFKASFISALEDDAVGDRISLLMQGVIEKALDPVSKQLNETIKKFGGKISQNLTRRTSLCLSSRSLSL